MGQWAGSPDTVGKDESRRGRENWSHRMWIGLGVFAVVAVLCVIIGVVAMKRQRDYGNSEGGDDDFDFDAYEGFDK
jgi:hypothetical protein